jgi:hypothetical protein
MSFSSSGIPARDDGSMFDGRSPGLRISVAHLPSRAQNQRSGMAPFGTTRMDGNPLTVAGAATVLDPLRVVRTVFPFRPVAFDSGNRHRQIKARPSRRQAGKDGSQGAETEEPAYEISAPVRTGDFGRDRLGEIPVIGEEKHTEPRVV